MRNTLDQADNRSLLEACSHHTVMARSSEKKLDGRKLKDPTSGTKITSFLEIGGCSRYDFFEDTSLTGIDSAEFKMHRRPFFPVGYREMRETDRCHSPMPF
jgi:hypothetical protein